MTTVCLSFLHLPFRSRNSNLCPALVVVWRHLCLYPYAWTNPEPHLIPPPPCWQSQLPPSNRWHRLCWSQQLWERESLKFKISHIPLFCKVHLSRLFVLGSRRQGVPCWWHCQDCCGYCGKTGSHIRCSCNKTRCNLPNHLHNMTLLFLWRVFISKNYTFVLWTNIFELALFKKSL